MLASLNVFTYANQDHQLILSGNMPGDAQAALPAMSGTVLLR